MLSFFPTLQETDDATAHYDADSKSFVVTVPKKVKGEHFPGLEMISDLLIPKGDTKLPNGPMVEVLGGVITNALNQYSLKLSRRHILRRHHFVSLKYAGYI